MPFSPFDIATAVPPCRAIAWLALLLVLLWGSGTGRALHERFEHRHPTVTPTAGQVALDVDDDAPAPAGATSPAPDRHHHGACETCALLAAMAAVIFIFVQFLLRTGSVLPLRRAAVRAPRLAAFLPATPTTGPPTLAC